MNKKICFVIMGFGEKTYRKNTFDLDKTYEHIIKPSAEECGLECIRADEIRDSSSIDKSMYALLIRADIVIADISTCNANAIYELGVRHAVKPNTTIILQEQSEHKYFDLSHIRTVPYSHGGKSIFPEAITECKAILKATINNTLNNNNIDSPLFESFPRLRENAPILTDEEFEIILSQLAKKGKCLYSIALNAKKLMEKGDFQKAAEEWSKAHLIEKNNPYYVQQKALCTYKQNEKEQINLTNAFAIIKPLDENNESNDPETLGLLGAIHKKIFLINNDGEYLRESIKYYKRGFVIDSNYYTGENYALCLELLASRQDTDNTEKGWAKFEAEKVRSEILDKWEPIHKDSKEKWLAATLAACHFSSGNDEKALEYEKIFLNSAEDWERDSYYNNKEIMMNLKQENSNG
ncbi:TRAFs-binding domain-containing protein [Lentisphaerota bacterium WC36G]|nr:DUF4071 domain-containing protein [Lentisphaerae bacterium WC36]